MNSMATIDTLIRRVHYGGRKGRRAGQRLSRSCFQHPAGGIVFFAVDGRVVNMRAAATLKVSMKAGDHEAEWQDAEFGFEWAAPRREDSP
jgi:hypothetical protein